ncbi:hypothetical protein E3Q00_02337 [Wallemia mellicola]|nr:hypothetical protein E3Q00_02337 [Wallemia mellicola]
MDFMNLAKKGMDAYQQSQGGNDHSEQSSNDHGLDFSSILGMAKTEHNDEGSHSMIESAISKLSSNSHELQDGVDEEETKNAHNKVFSGDKENASPKEHGIAYAYDLYQKHYAGGQNQTNEKDSDLFGKVIAEASKLADKNLGGKSSDDKQSVIDSATMTFGKLMIKQKLSGGSSGGLSSLAGQFLK